MPKDDVAAKVSAVLNTPGLHVTNADLLLEAVADYVDLNVDFIDAYNAAWMLRQSMSRVLTFDRRHLSHRHAIVVEVPGESASLGDRDSGNDAPDHTPGP